MPVDLRASEAADEPVSRDRRRASLSSDPEDVIPRGERDVAFFFRSDRQNLIGEANEAIFEATSDIFESSIRRGFAAAACRRDEPAQAHGPCRRRARCGAHP